MVLSKGRYPCDGRDRADLQPEDGVGRLPTTMLIPFFQRICASRPPAAPLSTRRPARKLRRSVQAGVEALEPRLALTVYTVSTAAATGTGSLREAIAAANKHSGADTIHFAIVGASKTIAVMTALPTITDPVVIDGTSQPGVTLRGSNNPAAINGLVFVATASGSAVSGLSINGFKGTGIRVTRASVDVHGNALRANGMGVAVSGACTGTTIVGNTIRGNAIGVSLASATGVGVTGNTISESTVYGVSATGNLAGTSVQSNGIRRTRQQGVHLDNATSLLLDGNAITGGRGAKLYTTGLYATGTLTHTLVRGNVISGNSGNGVLLSAAKGLSLGLASGTPAGINAAANRIVQNGGHGLRVQGDSSRSSLGKNTIVGNAVNVSVAAAHGLAATASNTSTPNLVLWHEGFKTPLGTFDFTNYTNSIVAFCKANQVSTAMITVAFPDAPTAIPQTIDASTHDLLQSFVTATESQGVSAGFCVTFSSYTKVDDVATFLSTITHSRPLQIGFDIENFAPGAVAGPGLVNQYYPQASLKPPTIMANFITPFQNALDAQHVTYSHITAIGGMGYSAAIDSWASPMTNAYEYYSQGDLNSRMAAGSAQPASFFAQFVSYVNSGDSSDIVKPANIGGKQFGWPAFAISRKDSDCLGGETADPSKLNPCGIADIFGQWSLSDFLSFLKSYQTAYDPGAIVIYQGDQLPTNWLTP